VKDSEWLADLVRHGLIRKSFVPPKPMRELRDLLRYRRKLVESAAGERNRLLAVLETANIKLANVASDVFGVSGRRMLEAIIEGTSTPAQMTVRHLAAWTGVAPGNNESAGKRKGGKARRGNFYLKTALVGAATSAAKAKGSYFKDKYHRLKARRGSLRAAVAIAHKILVAAFHILSQRVTYHDLGDAYLDYIDRTRTAKNLVRRLERLGFAVDLKAMNSPENANSFS
jgi:hypothetical protein